jgi:hypothetical protein
VQVIKMQQKKNSFNVSSICEQAENARDKTI